MKLLNSLPVLFMLCFASPLSAETIAFISDLNGRYGSTTYHQRVGKAVAAIIAAQPRIVVSTGDMVAGQKQPKLNSEWLDQMWDGFDSEVIRPLDASGLLLLPTAGNHDGSGFPGFELERERFNAYWQRSKPDLQWLPGSQWPRRYAVSIDDVLYVTFDGTRPGRIPQVEREFLQSVLQEHAGDASAVIVFAHLPMWPLAKGREKEILDDQSLLDLLHQYQVDVYASGHHHVYYPGLDSKGMLHLGIGALGGNARAYSGRSEREPHGFVLLDIENGQIQVSARVSPGFKADVDTSSIPDVIEGPLGSLKLMKTPALKQED